MNPTRTDNFSIQVMNGQVVSDVDCEAVLHDDTWTLRMRGGVPDSEARGYDLFEALSLLRAQLEPAGFRFLINGCRQNAWPSGMQREQGGGRAVYLYPVIEPGARTTEYAPTFGPAPAESVVDLPTQQRAIDTIHSDFPDETRA